jgi:tetratricopeptide (TPR) repeat protein
MSSFRRNIRRANSETCSRALGAGLALALASTAALAGGADVVAGRYHAALEQLTRGRGRTKFDVAAVNTNLCVAYSMTLQLGEARTACDAAVRTARERRGLPSAWWNGTRPSAEDSQAIAYANRAVMYWLLHDRPAAQKDLARARELSPRSDFVAQNLAALKMHSGLVAQADAPAPRR